MMLVVVERQALCKGITARDNDMTVFFTKNRIGSLVTRTVIMCD